MNRPLVSVVIPSYNRAHCLKATVDSAAAQTFKDFEIIIADDGSTDNTAEVVKTLQTDFRYLPFPHGGKSAVLNRALKECRGEWIAILDSDDLWLPAKLERQFEAIQRFSQCQFCFTDVILQGYGPDNSSAFTQSGKQFSEPLCCIKDSVSYVFATPHDIFVQASLIRRDLLERMGGFNEALIAEDTDIIFRASLETEFAVVNEPLVIIDRMPANRAGSIMSQIKGSREVDLKYRQAMYEGWLKLGPKLNSNAEYQVRQRLAGVHEAWANWHLESARWNEAKAEMKRAVSIQSSAPRRLKLMGIRVWPGGTAALLRKRAAARKLATS